jgi:hypothetical protein
MKINGLRLSFISMEIFTQPLRSLKPPPIPFSFLLSGPLLEGKLAEALNGQGPFERPLRSKYGKLFWSRYLAKRPATTKDLWRGLIPLSYQLDFTVAAKEPIIEPEVRVYLYPWGIGLIIDMEIGATLELGEAASLAQAVRYSEKFDLTTQRSHHEVSLKGLMDFSLGVARGQAYGPNYPKGEQTEMFTVATVLDADGTDPTQPVVPNSDLHRTLEAMCGWNPLWKSLKLNPLAESSIEIRKSPPGHLLYAGRRGRVVWFPGSFQSVGPNQDTLSCYHRNLSVAALHVESLCRICKDAADAVEASQPFANFSTTYRTCAQFAAGILGRLYGGTFDTYRSHSISQQIANMYKDPVNAMRKQFGMDLLRA